MSAVMVQMVAQAELMLALPTAVLVTSAMCLRLDPQMREPLAHPHQTLLFCLIESCFPRRRASIRLARWLNRTFEYGANRG